MHTSICVRGYAIRSSDTVRFHSIRLQPRVDKSRQRHTARNRRYCQDDSMHLKVYFTREGILYKICSLRGRRISRDISGLARSLFVSRAADIGRYYERRKEWSRVATPFAHSSRGRIDSLHAKIEIDR